MVVYSGDQEYPKARPPVDKRPSLTPDNVGERSMLNALIGLVGSAISGVGLPHPNNPNIINGYPVGHPIWKNGEYILPGAGENGEDMLIPDIGPAGWKGEKGGGRGKVPFSNLGTGNVKPFTGGTPITLAYFLNAFGEEMSSHQVPFPVHGLIL